MYLLLLRFSTPTDPQKAEWHMYDSLEYVRLHVERVTKETDSYKRFPQYGPVLLQYQVLKVEGVDV